MIDRIEILTQFRMGNRLTVLDVARGFGASLQEARKVLESMYAAGGLIHRIYSVPLRGWVYTKLGG